MNQYPTGLQIVDDTQLQIDWNDGQVRRYSIKELRDCCPCASCREKRRHARKSTDALELNILSPEEAQPLRIVKMKPVGNYAYTIVFSDGHDSGIFPFELLLELGQSH